MQAGDRCTRCTPFGRELVQRRADEDAQTLIGCANGPGGWGHDVGTWGLLIHRLHPISTSTRVFGEQDRFAPNAPHLVVSRSVVLQPDPCFASASREGCAESDSNLATSTSRSSSLRRRLRPALHRSSRVWQRSGSSRGFARLHKTDVRLGSIARSGRSVWFEHNKAVGEKLFIPFHHDACGYF